MNISINEKILKLKKLMEKNFIDTYIITKSNPHQSEFSDEYWNGIKFISGFSGSAGIIAITRLHTYLCVDGRYHLQAENELKNTLIKIYKQSELDFLKFVLNKTKEGGTIGFDGRTVSLTQIKYLTNMNKLNIKIKSDLDLLNDIWYNRPLIKQNNLLNLSIKYTGKNINEKIEDIKNEMKKYNADFYIISSLDDIAWLFNIRCINTSNSFSLQAYTVISQNNTVLFININKNDTDIINKLKKYNIVIKKYNDIWNYINNINNNNKVYKLLIDPSKTSYKLYLKISKMDIEEIPFDFTTILKSKKNKIEIENLYLANIKYSVCLVKLIKWIKENILKINITEFNVVEKLEDIRSKDKNYLCPSFETISAYNENAAIIHYNPNKSNCKLLSDKGLLLLDSGANYLEGTTDVTRTIVLGKISNEIKKLYTLVLKGLINLSNLKFIYGSTGSNIDIIARLPLWENGFNYKHGTGHGIGFCLNVHEGPQRIAMKDNSVVLEEGMIVSNEPGIYLKNKFGIRLENTLLIKKLNKTEFGQFMNFKTLSFIPFELDAINISLLNKEEINWINKYHKTTYHILNKYLNEEEKIWLKNITKEIN